MLCVVSMTMEIRHLEAFLAVAEELHFGRAADRLHIAQPPLTRAIKHLEKEFGTELFTRTTRKVQLTSAGEALLAPARQVLEDCHLARRSVQSAGRGETGRVRVGFAGPSSQLMIGALGRRVRERHPGIELSLQNKIYAYQSIRSLLDGDLDLAIARWTVKPAGVSDRIVAIEHYVLVVPSNHELAEEASVSIGQCRDEDFITLPADPGSSVRDAFMRLTQEAGYAPRIVQVVPDTWTAVTLVAAGVGVFMALDTAVANAMPGGISVVPLDEGRRPTFSRLVWRSGDTSPALHAVLHASLEVLPTPELPSNG